MNVRRHSSWTVPADTGANMRFTFAAIIFFAALSRCAAFTAASYNSVLQELSGSSYVTVGSAGVSVSGRDITYLVITDPGSASEKKMRVLVMSGQHGNEMGSVHGVLSLSKMLAFNESKNIKQLRRDVLFIIVPLVNPDGAFRDSRENDAGIDLNRDWIDQTQPEVRAITSLEKAWKPELILDEHQWLDGDEGASEFVETGNQIGAEIIKEALAQGRLGSVKTVVNKPSANPALSHRYFSRQGVAAFIIESGCRGSAESDVRFYHRITTDIILTALAERGDDGYRPGSWSVPPIVTRHLPVVKAAVVKHNLTAGVFSFVLLGCYMLLVAVLKSSWKCRIEVRKPARRVSSILPRREHDLIYWMNRPRFSARSSSRRNTALL